ncbi:uncharacterized protein LOC112453737 [Temnothorax curvispinosus]|uniref:Uncharacterized protein LOC112453737 n=1 Tax=Temnothorax curvispinosus TaxID=300111 RepID=A0A6J1PM57_9HYME|nr:uncharacterized protein LOC112453737 [Temnothorax curvispinosus]
MIAIIATSMMTFRIRTRLSIQLKSDRATSVYASLGYLLEHIHRNAWSYNHTAADTTHYTQPASTGLFETSIIAPRTTDYRLKAFRCWRVSSTGTDRRPAAGSTLDTCASGVRVYSTYVRVNR